MKKIAYALMFLFVFCFFNFYSNAQSLCSAVSVEVIESSSQSGQFKNWGIRVFIAQPYYDDITVEGTIEGGFAELWTLTIPAGNTSAQTSDNYYQTDPVTTAVATITNVSACPVTPETLASDNDFVELTSLFRQNLIEFDSIVVFMNDQDYNVYSQKLEALLSQSELKETELDSLVNLLNFPSRQLFLNYVENGNNLINNIKNRYSIFTSGSSEGIQQLVGGAYALLYNPSYSEGCRDRLANCRSNAHATYTIEVFGCTAGAFTLGALSFGVGGAVFQVGCGSAAIWHLRTMLRECGFQYRDCIIR